MGKFLAMGGYAQWVWRAFGLTVIVLIGKYHRGESAVSPGRRKAAWAHGPANRER